MKLGGDFTPQVGTADYVKQKQQLLFWGGFFVQFCIYRSTPHLGNIVLSLSCLFTVIDQRDGAGMCFIDILKTLIYAG